MKKFKEFYILTRSNYELTKAVLCYAEKLGYEPVSHDSLDYVKLFGTGRCLSCTLPLISSGFKKLTLDEFFALTPEDVVINPDKKRLFRAYLMWSKHGLSEINALLTQSQIDEIKAIMEREA